MRIPDEVAELLRVIGAELPDILPDNLVGVYVWGSLTYEAFDEACSDIDLVAVTQRDVDDREFAALNNWFVNLGKRNHWAGRIDMRFVIDGEFLDKTSRCCGFYHYQGKLTRHGSDGNPFIWLNVGKSGITLWGKHAATIAPRVSDRCLSDALLLELNYLKDDLASNVGNQSDQAFIHNAYAVLTACRIFYTARHRTLVSKQEAMRWAMENVPPQWRPVIQAASDNRLKNGGITTAQLEQDGRAFVELLVQLVRAQILD
ncbi:MAG TPA: aminoglycoside adenylyltransferase domain-containing protein [Bryobacteraceae bacterium]|nr:aminoglycoside adenylyltransferase domain-containing protein [Bryobacteraceae bacterium]